MPGRSFKIMMPRFLALVILMLGVGSCLPRTNILPGKPPRVGLVLGGGAARGFAHVGVIRVLEREKIPIDLIVGTSVGSLVGAIYADKRNSFELEWIAFGLEERHLFDFTVFSIKQGPVKGNLLEEFVSQSVSARNIQDLKIPFAAVATDISQGTAVVLSSGPVAKAVRASCSIPGIFHPVPYNGRLLVDGGVVANVAVNVARNLGADVVIAVDVSAPRKAESIDNVFDVILQATNIMEHEITQFRLKDADIVIQPPVGTVGLRDFSKKKELMLAGIRAAEESLPRIRAKIGNARRS